MKKVLLGLALALFLAVPVMAQETVVVNDNINVVEKKFSGIFDGLNWKQGFAWSLQESSPNYLSTVELLKFEKYVPGLTFEAGYAGDGNDSDHKVVVVMSYPLLNLKNLGVTTPILDLVEANIGVWFGAGHLDKDMMDSRSDYGLSLSLINIKF